MSDIEADALQADYGEVVWYDQWRGWYVLVSGVPLTNYLDAARALAASTSTIERPTEAR